MASQKINVAQKAGNMVVTTQSIATVEGYVTIVLKGEEVWDVALSNTVDDARAMHEQFVLMCQVFNPLVERLASGEKIDKETAVQELQHDYDLLAKSKRSPYVH